MKTEKKYKEILQEVVRNEAVSTDKLKMLAEKHGANKLKIEGFLRKAGVIKNMGNGVNHVLIRGQNIDPFVAKILEFTKGGYKKVKKNTDTLAKIKAFVAAVQENTNKQNERIAELDIRTERAFQKIGEMSTVAQLREEHNAESHKLIDKLIAELDELRIKHEKKIWDNGIMHTEEIAKLKNRLKEYEDHNERQLRAIDENIADLKKLSKTNSGNGGVLKALHQLLGEIV